MTQLPGELTCTLRSELKTYWVVTVLVGGVFAGFVINEVLGTPEGETFDLGNAFPLVLFGLAWAGFVAWTVFRELDWRSLGTAHVLLKRSPPRLGQPLVVHVRFDTPPQPDTVATAELMCERKSDSGIGKNRKTQQDELWKEEKEVVSASMFYVTFDPPANLPPESGGGNNGTFWWLRIKGRGGSRFNRRIRIPMRSATTETTEELLERVSEVRSRGSRISSSGLGVEKRGGAVPLMLGGFAVMAVVVGGNWALTQWPDSLSGEGEYQEVGNGLDAGTEAFDVAPVQLSGDVQLGDLRHLNFERLSARLRGRYVWEKNRLEIQADDITVIPRLCEDACPKIVDVQVLLTRWNEVESQAQSGMQLAQSEVLTVNYDPLLNQPVELGRRTLLLLLDAPADPRTAALSLRVNTQEGQHDFGLAFGGAAEWQGLDRTEGNAEACAALRGPMAAIDHFCAARLEELLPDIKSRITRERLLFHATRRGNVAAVDALVKAGVNVDAVNERQYTPLMEAGFGDLPEVMARLIAAGADIEFKANAESEYGPDMPLTATLLGGSAEGARLLLNAGVSLQQQGGNSPAAHLAVEYDVPEVLALMKAKGADLNERAAWGNLPTPLMAAAGMGKLAAIDALLALGVDTAAADSAGNTARDYAATHGQAEALKRLESFPGICPLSGCEE